MGGGVGVGGVGVGDGAAASESYSVFVGDAVPSSWQLTRRKEKRGGRGGKDTRLRMETPRAMADLETADHYCRYLLRLTAAGGNRDPKTEQAPLAIERTGLHFATEQAPERTRLSQLL